MDGLHFSKYKIDYKIIVLIILLIIVIVLTSLLAWVPPVSRDALIHHLEIPKLYLKHGGIYEIPDLTFSYYPMNLELLYLIPLYFGNDILPKFIHFAFALITAAMIFTYLKQRINRTYAMFGALFFLSIPIIVRLSGEVYVDLGLMCFAFASLLYLLKWINTGFEIKPLILSAIFCGLSLGTKYNGLICLFLIALFIPFVYSKKMHNQRHYTWKAIGYTAVFVAISMIVFSPWMIRNYVWTHNPVYPLYNSFFNPEKANTSSTATSTATSTTINKTNAKAKAKTITKAKTTATTNVTGTSTTAATAITTVTTTKNQKKRRSLYQVRTDLYGENFLEIVLIPLRVFFTGRDNNPKYFDGRLSPFLLLLPIFAIFGIKKDSPQVKTEKKIFLSFSILFLLFVYVSSVMRIRYFAPIIPPLVILSMYGLYNISQLLTENRFLISSSIKNFIMLGTIIIMLGLNFLYMKSRFEYVMPFDYITGRVSRNQYIQRNRPEFASFQYANTHLSNDTKILGLYLGNRGYYCNKEIHFDLNLLKRLAADAKTPQTVYQALKKRGFTHFVINFELFNYWVKDYTLHEKKILKSFFKYFTSTEFSRDGCGLLRLKQPSS